MVKQDKVSIKVLTQSLDLMGTQAMVISFLWKESYFSIPFPQIPHHASENSDRYKIYWTELNG